MVTTLHVAYLNASSRDADSAAEDRVPEVVDAFTGEPKVGEALTPLPTVAELLELEDLSYVEFLDSLKAGELAEGVLLRPEGGSQELNFSSVMDSEVLEDERTARRQARYGAAVLNDPITPLLKEFSDVVSDDPPTILSPDRGVRHEIDLGPGTKYFQVATLVPDVLCAQAQREVAHDACLQLIECGYHSGVNAYPPKGCVAEQHDRLYGSALDMIDGYYQLLMRESDIPLTAVSTPIGMLWEWLVMPQGLSNAPATFIRIVTQLFRPMRHFVETYFDDIFVHSRASEGKTAVETHLGHLREVLLCMRENHLYADINKCIFGAEEIPFLGCFLGKDGVRADPEKVCAIAQWPVPVSQKDLRKWLGLVNYLHEYSANYADMARPLTNLLKKNAVWSWTSEAQQAFGAIKSSLQSAPILALPTRIGLSAWYAMHPTLPLAVPCYRLMPRTVRGAFIHGFHSVLREWAAAHAYATDVAVGIKFGGAANAEDPRGLQGLRTSVKRNLLSFIETGEAVRQRVRDAMAAAQDSQKEQSGRQGRVHGHAYMLDLPSSMATHPTFYVGLLKPYRPAGAAEPAGSTASPSTDGRRPPSPERTVPREPGQERESERQPEPLRGVRLAFPSGPPGHTDSGSRRGDSPSLGAPIRRSPRLANIGPAGGRLRHQDGISVQATATRGLADGLRPGGHPGVSPGGSPLLGHERAAPPSQTAGHPAVVDRTSNRPEGSPGQDGSQSDDTVRPGRTPFPSRAPSPLLDSEGALYYHVEKLLKRRGRSGQHQNLVKWRGYRSSRNSWEPGARLEEGCADLVAAFDSAHEPGRR
ncbi:unnamed protein product [Phytophthora fragariaefolia]|uniref:Unnamed protein product n=1 Tax=Phytophthora fragariaefolia TaxID=1490495 RepID=A0A9W6XY26_9STRA|nr:unnamed protein product [Phytophthora fragariaefolia]